MPMCCVQEITLNRKENVKIRHKGVVWWWMIDNGSGVVFTSKRSSRQSTHTPEEQARRIPSLTKQGYSLRNLQTTFENLYGRHTNFVHKFDTSVTHTCMLTRLFTNCDIWLVSSYLAYIVTGAACGTGNAHSFRNTSFHSLGSSWFHPFHYIYIIYYWICRF